jgi:hypothetical protein
MFKGLARFIVYSLLCIPLIIVAVLILRQVQYAFNLRTSFLKTENHGSYLNAQQAMAANELSTKTFFLIFVCFLMILCGLFLILRGTDNAFYFSKETRVRYSLKTAYPGVIMAIAGSTLLAYSIYQSQQQQVNITQQLQLLLARQSIAPVENGVVVYQKDLDTSVAREAQNTVAETLPDAELPEERDNTDINPVAAVVSVHPAATTILPEEIDWVNQLASRSVAFGYDPSNEDFDAYNDISSRVKKSAQVRGLNVELQWAFGLLQRTKSGYQPTDREMNRYESIVTDQLREKNKVTIN